jgi:hypothetical protein
MTFCSSFGMGVCFDEEGLATLFITVGEEAGEPTHVAHLDAEGVADFILRAIAMGAEVGNLNGVLIDANMEQRRRIIDDYVEKFKRDTN